MKVVREFDYAAEVARTRAAQGLPAAIPADVRDAVAALLGSAVEEVVDHGIAA